MTTAWVFVGLGIFLIGLTKSGFGAGVGLLNVPLIAIAMDYTGRGSAAGLGLMLPLLMAGDLIAVWQYRKLFSMNIVKHLLPGTFVGVVIGGLLLWYFYHRPPNIAVGLIKTEIGLECILLVGLHWWRQMRGVQTRLMPEPWRSHITGWFAAVSSTLAHAAGPIVTMYLLPLKIDRQLFVGTCAIYFFILNSAKLPAYYFSGMFANASPIFSLQFLPILIAGALFGFWINRKINDVVFGRIVYTVTFLLGWYMLYDGITTAFSLHSIW
jgi:uncharacterized protein